MGLDPKPILEDIDRVLTEASTHLRGTEQGSLTRGQAHALMLCVAAIRRYAPPGSVYVARANHVTGGAPGDAARVVGFLDALRSDYQHNSVPGIGELLRAEAFGDYLGQASHLLEEGYYLPAAVVAGSTLEAHLRAIADNAQLDVNQPDGKPKKATVLVADLARVQAISKGDEKQIIAWLDLRNLAAHGHADKFDGNRVALFIDGLRDFIRRVPA